MTRELEKLAECPLKCECAAPKKTTEEGAGALKKAFLDEGVSPLLWGAGGGVGGYLAADKLLNPLLRMREANVEHQMRRGEQILKRLRSIRKLSPLVGGIGGALLLAALATDKAKERQKERIDQYGDFPAYQHGFSPSEVYSVNDPRARIF